MMDNEQFKQYVERYKNLIYSKAYYFTGNPEDAADITQEVLLKMWTNLDSLDEKSIKAWLLKVTRNQCIDVYRKKREYVFPVSIDSETGSEIVQEQVDDHPDPEQQALTADLQDRIKDAIGELPPPIRLAIIQREIQELSYSEIAETLEIPLNTVKVYIHRGRRMLFKILQKDHREGVNP
jgi:RNA polymerase sigma-70 factor (ECF subfamily)